MSPKRKGVPETSGLGTSSYSEESHQKVRKRSLIDDKLKRSEERFRTLIENSSDAITVLNADGTLRYESPSMSRILGYEPGATMGKTSFELVHPDDLPQVAKCLSKLLESPGGTEQLDVRVQHKDGSWRTLEVVARNLLDDPAIEGVVVSQRDITERKQAEEAIREAENRYRAIFDNRLVMVFVNDENGVFLDANDAALDRLGYSRSDLGKIAFQDLLSPEDLTYVFGLMEEGRGTGRMPVPQELRLRTASGGFIWVEVLGLAQELRDGHYVGLGMALDITERKSADAQLRESEERLRLYLDSSPDGIYISDAKATFLYGNRAAERIVGYSRDELIGKSWLELDLLAEEYHDKAVRLLKASAAGMPTGPDEFELIRKDRSRVFVEISTYPIGQGDNIEVIGIARDITDRKQMETAVRESEESLRALIENAPDSITVYDLNGTIVDCNRRGEELVGYSREEMVGKSMFEIGIIPEDYVARASRSLEKNAFSQTDHPFEFDLLRKDSSRLTVEATTITVERGGKPQIICISRDVTQRKQMEQQLHLAGRLAAVGQLAAGVAHELNNPLSAVQGFAQFLAQRSNLDEATKGDIETIYREAQRATKITSNLLSFARKYTPEKRLISVNEALEHSLELHAYRMRVNNVEVVTQLDPDLPKTMADFHQMQQVFVNIITNAEQALTEVHGKGRLVVKTKRVGDMIRVSFTDDGPGIPDDILKSVFDPFFTTKEVGQGTGLGLSICYGIVREHGGRLYAKSDTGKGATFVMEIPIVSEDQNAAEEADASHTFHTTPQQQ